MKKSFVALTALVSLCSMQGVSAAILLASSYSTDNVLKYDAANGNYLGEFISVASGGLNQPQGFTFGNDGLLYISSFGSKEIKRYDAGTGAYVDNFAATASGSRGLDFDDSGNLYAAYGSSVTRFSALGVNDTIFTHTFAATATGVLQGTDHNIYVSWGSNSILGGIARYDVANNTWNDTWRTGIPGQAWYMATDANGTFYLGTSGSNQIYRDNGSSLVAFSESTTDLDRPRGLVVNPDGDLLVGGFGGVSRSNILKFDGVTGAYDGVFATGGGINQPFYLGIAPVPVPAAVWLFSSALLGFGMVRRHSTIVKA